MAQKRQKVAATQNLPAARDRLQQIIDYDLPSFLYHRQPAAYPIIDYVGTEKGGTDDSDMGKCSPDFLVNNIRILGLRKFKTDLLNEIKILDKFIARPGYESLPPLSTNSPYLIAVWEELKVSQGVIAVGSVFPIRQDGASSTSSTSNKYKSPLSNGTNSTTHEVNDGRTSVKVDVVSEGGSRWTRISTLTADRLLRELYELGDYESSDDEETDEGGSNLARSRDNSLYEMGARLSQAAKASAVLQMDSASSPTVHIRFTRLFPGPIPDERIGSTKDEELILHQLSRLRSLGLHVHLGSRTPQLLPPARAYPQSSVRPGKSIPTQIVNLDLSLLIALCSDITHSAPPVSDSDAHARFQMPSRKERLNQAQQHNDVSSTCHHTDGETDELVNEDAEGGMSTGGGEHARALAAQAMQESRCGLIADIRARCYPSLHVASASSPIMSPASASPFTSTTRHISSSPPKFVATREVLERCLVIVDKIGGTQEIRRSKALCSAILAPDSDAFVSESSSISSFWKDSRYPLDYIPNLVPVQPIEWCSSYFPTPYPDQSVEADTFSSRLRQTCLTLLSQSAPAPRGSLDNEQETTLPQRPASPSPISNIVPLSRHKIGPSARSAITPHTLRSLLIGTGTPGDTTSMMTTLTANRASIRAILKRMEVLFPVPLLVSAEVRFHPAAVSGLEEKIEHTGVSPGEEKKLASIWIVEPRSLAEGMRAPS